MLKKEHSDGHPSSITDDYLPIGGSVVVAASDGQNPKRSVIKLNSKNNLAADDQLDDFFQFEGEGGEKKAVNDEDVRDPKLGAFYMQIFVIGLSVNWLVTKLIYIYYPKIEGLQMLMFRNLIGSTFIYIYTNSEIKDVMWDSVPAGHMKTIWARITIGGTNIACNFYMFKYWKLSTISMVMSLAPILTVIFGIFIIGETVNRSDMLQMFLSMFAVVFIIFNSLEDRKELSATPQKSIEDDSLNYARRDHLDLFTCILLLICPAGLAMQNVLLRKMKKLRFQTLSCYVNPLVMICCYIVLTYLGKDTSNFIVDIVQNQPKVLCLFLFLGIQTVVLQILNFKAHQHEYAAKNMVWTYMGPPFQWIYDYFLIQSYFNKYQVISFLILLIVYYLKIKDVYLEVQQTPQEEQKGEDMSMVEEEMMMEEGE